MRITTAHALSQFLKHGKEAAPPLIRALLGDKDGVVRSTAAEALGQLGRYDPDIPGAVAALTKALGDAAGVRSSVLHGLAGFRSGAQSAVPKILPFASHADPRTREEAVTALMWIDPGAKACIEVFKKALADDAARRSAARGLGKGGAAHECVPLLLDALKAELRGRNGGECYDMAYALGEAGAVTPEVVPALINLLDHVSGSTRLNAAEALGKIGAQAKEAIPALEKLLKDTRGEVCKEAAEHALSKIKG
jgi:HEAT repeat protein